MIQLHSRVGSDGVLKLTVPLGQSDANADVVVTIYTLPGREGNSAQMPWLDFLDKTYGSCADVPLERASQGDYDSREIVD